MEPAGRRGGGVGPAGPADGDAFPEGSGAIGTKGPRPHRLGLGGQRGDLGRGLDPGRASGALFRLLRSSGPWGTMLRGSVADTPTVRSHPLRATIGARRCAQLSATKNLLRATSTVAVVKKRR